MMPWTALVTLLAIIFYLYTGVRVASARSKVGVKAPVTTGHRGFERIFRVQVNTFGMDAHLIGYEQAAEKRGRGFDIQTLAAAILWVGALVGIVTRLVSGG
jgi:glutathione S-transferase